MKKNSTIALLLVVLVQACSSTGRDAASRPTPAPASVGAEVSLSDADRSAVESAVRDRLGQPAASFRTMIGQRSADGTVIVCGYFNAGSGDTPFVGSLDGPAFAVSNLGGTVENTIAVQKACHGRGIYI